MDRAHVPLPRADRMLSREVMVRVPGTDNACFDNAVRAALDLIEHGVALDDVGLAEGWALAETDPWPPVFHGWVVADGAIIDTSPAYVAGGYRYAEGLRMSLPEYMTFLEEVGERFGDIRVPAVLVALEDADPRLEGYREAEARAIGWVRSQHGEQAIRPIPRGFDSFVDLYRSHPLDRTPVRKPPSAR